MTASQLCLSESSDNQIMMGTDGFVLLPKISIGVPVQQSTQNVQQSTQNVQQSTQNVQQSTQNVQKSTFKTELSSLSLKVNNTKLPEIYSTASGGCLCGCPNYTVHMLRLNKHRYKLQLGTQIYNKTQSL
ncbi:MAG: hypothetical protein HOA34_06805 [Flavobacterium sp.]|jgi:hypothetical protein|nr:hypothetical protein [Flavobacterium sp.]